jgi:hypothetical protein
VLLDGYRINVAALDRYVARGFPGSALDIRTEASMKEMAKAGASIAPLPVANRRVIQVPGDHFSIWDEPRRAALAAALSGMVADARTPGRPVVLDPTA